MTQSLSRRHFITKTSAALLGAGLMQNTPFALGSDSVAMPGNTWFRYCLNTGTVRGHKLGLIGELELAAKAGYDAVEPWVESLRQYQEQGKSLPELKQRITDLGLTVESAIGFASWIVDDADKRAQGLEQARRDMDLLSQIGARRLAAPPSGATSDPVLDLQQAADRYRVLLELSDGFGVVPALEIWGFSKNINRLGQAAYVAIESGHAKACVLADVFHLYKGGSDFSGLKLLSAQAVQIFHMNDYPAGMSREQVQDRDRVFPGDGTAPLGQILRDLYTVNPNMVLSLELFNAEYWKRPALDVAREGLAKMKMAVQKAMQKN